MREVLPSNKATISQVDKEVEEWKEVLNQDWLGHIAVAFKSELEVWGGLPEFSYALTENWPECFLEMYKVMQIFEPYDQKYGDCKTGSWETCAYRRRKTPSRGVSPMGC